MAKRIISLRYPAVCADCGASLPAGSPARFYGRGRVYGTECHSPSGSGSGPEPARVYTFETSGGSFTRCDCEDYPCCGH